MALTIVAVGAYVAALLLWDDIAARFLPNRYREASELLMILLPGTLAGMVTAPLALPFVLFVKKRLIFTMDLWLLPFLLILYYFLIDTRGALGAAIVVTTGHLLRSLLVLFVAWRLSRRDNPLQLRSERDIA
jgi:O-antigen/teichoic acid export membrane protein